MFPDYRWGCCQGQRGCGPMIQTDLQRGWHPKVTQPSNQNGIPTQSVWLQTPLFFLLQPDVSLALPSPHPIPESPLRMHIQSPCAHPNVRDGFSDKKIFLCAENQSSFELHSVVLALHLGVPQSETPPTSIWKSEYHSDSDSLSPLLPGFDFSYGWFNTSLIVEGRRYLPWLTERWEFQLWFKESTSQGPGCLQTNVHGICFCFCIYKPQMLKESSVLVGAIIGYDHLCVLNHGFHIWWGIRTTWEALDLWYLLLTSPKSIVFVQLF